MALSISEYNQRVQAWINEQWAPTTPCPMCRTASGWELAPPANMGLRDDLQGTPMGQILPLVPLVCVKCGYVVFLAATKLGIIGPDGTLGLPTPDAPTSGGTR